ncbi:MAG: magnesium transporter [Phycisphaerae bacterium]|nr:magnesium transporter [Phycisphaerae bacterium]
MKQTLLVPELRELLAERRTDSLRRFCEEGHPAIVAELIGGLDPGEIWQILRLLPVNGRAEIFSHFDLDQQAELAGGESRQAMASLLEELPHDDRADLVQHLDPQVAEQILPLVAKAEREDIRKLTSYAEGTAGALMSSDYATLRPDMTVSQALEQIRLQAPTKETIYYIYVVDDQHRLIGFVSLKDLILARPAQWVRDVMHEDVIRADVNEDQEPVARKIEKYDLLAIPVTNGDGKLVGIITHDDAMDVIRQEQQEDVEKFMAIGGEHQAGEYLRTHALVHFRNRVVWVVILGVLGLVSGLIVQNFEGLLLHFAVLAAFMPMLADTGGNTGSQSATLVVRALALGEVGPRDVLRIILKEFQVSVLLAAVLALVAFARVLAFGGGSTMPEGYSLVWVGVAISIALGLQVISATLIGAILPLLAAKMKRDPAVIASPALTTVVDITGLLLFFGTAKLLLGV